MRWALRRGLRARFFHQSQSIKGRGRPGAFAVGNGLKHSRVWPQTVLQRATSVAVAMALLCVGGQGAQAQEPDVVPPEVQSKVEAVYPPAAVVARQEAMVVLAVTVDVTGEVVATSVLESGGEAFDRAAVDAVLQWKFLPAKRGKETVVSKIRVPFAFVLPAVGATQAVGPAAGPVAPPPDAAPVSDAAPESSKVKALSPQENAPPALPQTPVATTAGAQSSEEVVDVTVHGRRTLPPRASSDFVLERDILTAAPHQTAADLLGAAPGMYVARPEGDAVAHQVFLRGFDAEHGQDIEFTLGAVPINQPSQIHGQGYADLNFVIPEVVRSMRVTEGVYDPRQGDFAVAGSVDFDLGVAERGYLFRSTYGSFNTFRQLALWAPKGESEETFAAVSVRRSNGFGTNRGSISGGGIAQYGFTAPAGFRGLVHVAAYGARANLAGVLRQDDIDSGAVGFYGSYNQPSANAQSAFAARAQAAVSLEKLSAQGASTNLALWFAFIDYRSRQNFTGFMERSRMRPEWVGRGDLVEQENHDIGFGARASHRTRRFQPLDWLSGHFELGMTFRTDFINQAQNLLQAPQNETWDQRVDATVRQSDLGAYADADWRISRWVQLRGGFRADVLYFDVNDRLGNFTPGFQRESHLPGFRRNAIGVAYGPRVTLEVKPLKWLDVIASYGQGYRSPQARQLEEGENAPFVKVDSVEGGVRIKPSDKFSLTAAGFATFLSSDLAFDPQEARLERVGPTSRKGVVAMLQTRPWAWALASLSVTYVRATLDAPPAKTAENPAPAFKRGQLLPYVPPVVLRADVGVHRDLAKVRGYPLHGRLGAGFTMLSARPLPYSGRGTPVALLDLSGSLKWRVVEFGLEVFNVLGSRYAATQYSFVSNWQTQDIPSQLPARHISAGAPRTVMGTLALNF